MPTLWCYGIDNQADFPIMMQQGHSTSKRFSFSPSLLVPVSVTVALPQSGTMHDIQHDAHA